MRQRTAKLPNLRRIVPTLGISLLVYGRTSIERKPALALIAAAALQIALLSGCTSIPQDCFTYVRGGKVYLSCPWGYANG